MRASENQKGTAPDDWRRFVRAVHRRFSGPPCTPPEIEGRFRKKLISGGNSF
jgi:hypothetical protein